MSFILKKTRVRSLTSTWRNIIFKTAINIDDSNEPFLAVLEYILIPKYINFYGKVDHYGG